MTLWLMRAGKLGERENLAIREKAAITGWDELPDMSACHTREDLDALMRTTYPTQKTKTLSNWHGQLWSVRDTIKPGDLAVLPLKRRASVVLGTVTGDYQYRRDLPPGPLHTRPVEWRAEVPRRAFDIDILLSFGAFMSVCRVERNDAEQRVRALLVDGPAPLPDLPAAARPPPPDTLRRSRDLIHERIAQRFKGHRLADLVAALLEAQGFRARVSPPGPDGGVDILAGSGPFGFDAPRIAVQVKSQDTKVDVRTLRELAGVMSRFGAEHGLLVGWGGFGPAVRSEASSDYFRVRLWDSGDLVTALEEHYPKLPLPIRAELPLKQVWTLAPEGEAAD